jgi:transcription antitermination factor NusA-like protein
MLAREMVVPRIEQDALLAARVIHDAGAKFRAVGTTHDERAHRIGAIINSKGE